MPDPAASNRLLGLLSPWAYTLLQADLEPRRLAAGELLCEVQTRTEGIVFPTSGVVSLATLAADGRSTGVALIGSDGALGAWLAIGLGRSPWDAVVRADGEAFAMPAQRFRTLLSDEPAFREQLLAYARALFDRGTEALACARLHSLEARLTRWLLEMDDRAPDGLIASVELLDALVGDGGPRSAAVLDALIEAGALERTEDDVLRTLDRAPLEASACDCYAPVGALPGTA